MLHYDFLIEENNYDCIFNNYLHMDNKKCHQNHCIIINKGLVCIRHQNSFCLALVLLEHFNELGDIYAVHGNQVD